MSNLVSMPKRPTKMVVQLLTIVGTHVCMAEVPCLTPPASVIHDGDVYLLDPSTMSVERPHYRKVSTARPLRTFT